MWKYARYPNYGGEILQWWGLWLLSIAVLSGAYWICIISPLFLMGLLLFCQRGAPAGEAGTPASVCVDCACQYAAQGAKASHHASVRSHVSQMASRLLCTLTTRHAGRSPEHSLIHTGTPLSSSTLTPTPLCVSAG